MPPEGYESITLRNEDVIALEEIKRDGGFTGKPDVIREMVGQYAVAAKENGDRQLYERLKDLVGEAGS